jgi:2'-5' RNA ligase
LGEFFTSFDDAWSHFCRRSEALEDFYADFPEESGAVLEGWVVEPSAEVRDAAVGIQRDLSDLDWLDPIPPHFLHVWIGVRERIGDAWRVWSALEAFPVTFARVNCFHTAVVVEVEGPLRRLVAGTPNDAPTFLPHLTVAVVREPSPPDRLRDLVTPLRELVLGEQDVLEVELVRFPAARSTLFRPWTVEQVVPLG